MEVHSVRNQRRRTGGETIRFQKVSGIRDSPVSRRSILSKSFKGQAASHAFVVLGGHPISSLGAGSDPFRSRGQTPWSGQKRLGRAMSVVDLAARKQCLPSGEDKVGDHLDHLGWDAIAARTLPV